MSQTHTIKDIPGYEGIYGITRDGRVYSYRRKRFMKARPLHGRLVIHLCVNYKHSFHFVHRLVYLTFVGPIPKGLEIDHINEDKSDNRLENLQTLTHQQNVQKYFDMRELDKTLAKGEY